MSSVSLVMTAADPWGARGNPNQFYQSFSYSILLILIFSSLPFCDARFALVCTFC